VPHVLGNVLCLTLSHASTDEMVIRVGGRHCRTLLKEPIVDLLRAYWHGEEHSCLTVVIVVLEVLQHKKCTFLSLLRWEHIHKGLITKSRECEPALPLSSLLYLVILVWLFALLCCLQLSEVLQVTRYHIRCHTSRLE
jgi:hypothetical protein